jgi:hypothetical protein
MLARQWSSTRSDCWQGNAGHSLWSPGEFIRADKAPTQETFDRFQKAIHSEGKHSRVAAAEAGDTGYERLGGQSAGGRSAKDNFGDIALLSDYA